LPRRKKGLFVGPTNRGKGTKWMVVVACQSNSIGSTLASVSPVDVKLAEEMLETINVLHSGRDRQKKASASFDW
jgi:hypothetical protein